MQVVTLVTICVLFFGAVRLPAGQADSTAPPLTKDPTKAVLLSIALPGLGQYYNEQYWKIPIFTGTWGVSTVLFFYNNSQYQTASSDYDRAVAGGASYGTVQTLLSRREAFRDNRDLCGVIVIATYVLSAVDAFVGAHLFDFDVSDDVSLGISPDQRSLAALRLEMRW